MTYEAMTHAMGYPTGEVCPACEGMVVISGEGPDVTLDCDCGSVSALCSDPGLPTAA